jgi:penicillin amidase
MKKVIISISVILIIIVLAVIIIGTNISRRALPDYSQPFRIKNLQDTVRIYRDSFAMAHVYAKNNADLYRVTGYLAAQDRLWQMDLLRHVTTGTLSEIFGKDLLDADILMRSLRIPEKSKMLYEQSSPELKEAFEAYSEGVNQYMEDYKKKLPFEFTLLGYKPEPWKPEHSFNLVGYMAWDLNGCWIAEIVLHKIKNKLGNDKVLELVPNFDSTQSVVFPKILGNKDVDWGTRLIAANLKIQELGLSIFHGSNNWAVNSDHSTNGKPILANDMHLGFNAPGVWYQIHQVVDGKLNVTGVMLPGQPFIISGHNEAIAWGMTNVMNDDIDFYKEEVNPADSNQYMFNGSYRPMLVRKEKIKIKGGDEIEKTLRFTHRGPIISSIKGIKDEQISMHWLGNEWSNEIRTVYLLNRANNWTDFKNALTSFISVSQNVVYADTAGNIGLYCSAGVPKRKGPAWEVLPGTTDEYDWKGLVPFDSLPHYYNPAAGIAVSANNKTAPADYPYYISSWYDLPFRYNRIKEMLLQTNKHSVETFKAIQTDFHSENVKYYLPKLVDIIKANKLNPLEENCFQLLNKWDMSMDEDKVAPTVYETFFMNFFENVFADELDDPLFKELITDKILVRNAIYRIWTLGSSSFLDDIKTTGVQENLNDIIWKSYQNAISELSQKYGSNSDNWTWGNIHQVTISHPMRKKWILNKFFHLNKGPYPIGGSFHTVEPFSYKYQNPFEVTAGASQRHIYVTGNWDDSWTVIPTGNSGIPASPYYCDQTNLYMNKKYKHDWFSRQAVERNAKYKLVIVP